MFKLVKLLSRLVQCTYSTGNPDSKFLKKRKSEFPTVKNIVFDSKITILAIDNNTFAEHDHRLKIENVVVADQKQFLINAFAIVACRCDTTIHFC